MLALLRGRKGHFLRIQQNHLSLFSAVHCVSRQLIPAHLLTAKNLIGILKRALLKQLFLNVFSEINLPTKIKVLVTWQACIFFIFYFLLGQSRVTPQSLKMASKLAPAAGRQNLPLYGSNIFQLRSVFQPDNCNKYEEHVSC